MIRTFKKYDLIDVKVFKQKMLKWCQPFNIFCLLENSNHDIESFDCILAVGAHDAIEMNSGNALKGLKEFKNKHQDWIFGHLGYDLKNEIEELSSSNHDGIGFPDLFFFIPEIILIIKKNQLTIGILAGEINSFYNQILSIELPDHHSQFNSIILKNRLDREKYISIINQLKEHIYKGDCYEINFCQEFYADCNGFNHLEAFKRLMEISPNPFSAYYKLHDKYLLCASPERFLQKKGKNIISQPIKGTAKRDLENREKDDKSSQDLLNNTKEKSENIMVADLVRNDLSKICLKGSVKVRELSGLYSFPQVHQLISTIEGILDTEEIDRILRSTFPMGSMTGVPKKKVMELIEKYESSKRGLYSGALGYFTPDDDFDFNVVIRSILYNDSQKYISIQAGSAITVHSHPIEEYDECILKIKAIRQILEV